MLKYLILFLLHVGWFRVHSLPLPVQHQHQSRSWNSVLELNHRFITPSTTAVYSSSSGFKYEKAGPVYLERMVEKKKVEVQNLLKQHQALDDPLVMRMSYLADRNKYNVTKALKRPAKDGDLHTMSITIDMKRLSPTIPHQRNIVEFSSAGQFSKLLAEVNVDSFLVNTDMTEYGGALSDIKETAKAVREAKLLSGQPPPSVIAKDLIIHPVQIAQALENGAAGVLLIVAVVGADLEVLLNACTLMGTEALVEVHTPNEVEFALSKGATLFLCNNWDRTTGKMFRDQAKGMAHLLPMNSVAIAAGNIGSMEEVAELGFYGFDGVVLGRQIAEVPDLQQYVKDVHAFRGQPRGPFSGMGMKGIPFGL